MLDTLSNSKRKNSMTHDIISQKIFKLIGQRELAWLMLPKDADLYNIPNQDQYALSFIADLNLHLLF